MKKILLLSIMFFLLISVYCKEGLEISPATGPRKGALFMAGGNVINNQEIMEEFKKLAGGFECLLTVVPTTQMIRKRKSEDFEKFWKKKGYQNVNVLYFPKANQKIPEEILLKLKNSNAVWFYGGNPMHHLNFYKNTKIEDILNEVVKKGGVIGGGSAGAMIQAEWLPSAFRAETDNFDQYKTFSFAASGITVIPHADARNLWDRLIPFVQQYPKLLGLALSNGSVALIQENILRVIGNKIAVYDSSVTTAGCDGESCYLILKHGDKFNIKTRKRIR